MTNPHERKTRLRDLNDRLRKHRIGGRAVMTCGIAALGPEMIARIDAAIRAFNTFTPDNDPHGEHDFGMLEVEGTKSCSRSIITTSTWPAPRPTRLTRI